MEHPADVSHPCIRNIVYLQSLIDVSRVGIYSYFLGLQGSIRWVRAARKCVGFLGDTQSGESSHG